MVIDNSRADALIHACLALEVGSVDAAKKIIERDFPFSQYVKDDKFFSVAEQLTVFKRDGFVDRFSGKRVFLPPVLIILSKELPEVFPRHPNWERVKTHQAHEMFSAAVKKIIPSGSSQDIANLVTVSYLNKLSMGNATLDDLGLRLLSLEEIAAQRWDGMSDWFVNYVREHNTLLAENAIATWYKAIQNF